MALTTSQSQLRHNFTLRVSTEVIDNRILSSLFILLTLAIIYVLLKALPPVCMKYTARDESRVANIARGEASCYICHKTLIKSCILSYKQSGSVKCFIVFYTNLAHFLNKQTGFFVEMCQ